MKEKNRIEWLDYMKGVAILIVVVGHVSQAIGEAYSFTRPIIIGEMPLFFFLSGLLADRASKRNIRKALKNKFRSLGIPFLSVGGIYAICTNQVEAYLTDLYHLSYWFLISLLSCWIVFIPLQKVTRHFLRNKTESIWKIMGGVFLFVPFITYRLTNEYIPDKVDDALSLSFTFAYYRFFVVGYFVGIYYRRIKSRATLWASTILTVVMLVLTCTDSHLLQYIPMTLQQLILSTCLSGTIYMLFMSSPETIRKAISCYGKDSLVIYIFHVIAVKYISLHFLQGTGEIYAFTGVLASSVLMCEVIILVSKPIKRNKYLRKYVLGNFSH